MAGPFQSVIPCKQETCRGVAIITGRATLSKLLPHRRSQPPANPEKEAGPCGGQCLLCVAACPSGALLWIGNVWRLDLSHCLGCRLCFLACPESVN